MTINVTGNLVNKAPFEHRRTRFSYKHHFPIKITILRQKKCPILRLTLLFSNRCCGLTPFYSMMELATTFATRLLMDETEPSSFGWTRFVRNITKDSVSGSIQRDVPV
jgi:hypothetical protein